MAGSLENIEKILKFVKKILNTVKKNGGHKNEAKVMKLNPH